MPVIAHSYPIRNAKGDKSRYIVTNVRYIVPRCPIPREYPKFRNIHVVPRYPVPMEVHVRVNCSQRLGTQDQILPAMEGGYLWIQGQQNMVYEVYEALSIQYQGRLCHALPNNL